MVSQPSPLGSESRLPTAPRPALGTSASASSQRLCLAVTAAPLLCLRSLCVILPHPVPAAPLEISRVPPTYRKGSKALRSDMLCPKQNICSRRSWDTDAALWMLLGPFPDPHPKGMGCGHTTAEDHTGQPHMAVGAQMPGPLGSGVGFMSKPGASATRLRPGSSPCGRKLLREEVAGVWQHTTETD